MPRKKQVVIDPLVYSAKFPSRCELAECASRCCRHGVWTDFEESKTILANADLFKPYVRAASIDPMTWFGKAVVDADCPSGIAVETNVTEGACALFHPECGCTIQKASIDLGVHPWKFKPRFCIMFPLVQSGNTLTVDEGMTGVWCMRKKNRDTPVLDYAVAEVDFLFDEKTKTRLATGRAKHTRVHRKTKAAVSIDHHVHPFGHPQLHEEELKMAAPAKKAVVKKAAPAKKVVAKKPAVKKAVVAKKAAPAKKVVAKKPAVKKAVVKKAAPAKKVVAKKAVAKKK